MVIHLSMRSYDAMYRVREGKSILLEPFYQLFRELFCHIFGAPGLMTCLNRVRNYCYVYRSDLTPFKCWSGFRFFLGLVASFLQGDSLVLHCASELRTIFASLARANERARTTFVTYM